MTADNILSARIFRKYEFSIETESLDEPVGNLIIKVIVSDLYHNSQDKIKRKTNLARSLNPQIH